MESDEELIRVACCLAAMRLALDEAGLTHGEAIDVYAVLFAAELEKALLDCGPAGVTASFERFMRRVSVCCRSLKINLLEVNGGTHR